MSAICGVLKLNGAPVVADELVPMMDALAVYGPDGQATWQAGPVALGHQMLWITPESRSEVLPWCHPHLDLVITADARIDNRDELLVALRIPPDEGVGMPDSQLILYAYEKWGQECPQHLLGDFAFAIWDGRTHMLFCARDQLGIKPFYYSWHPACFVFASDIRGVLAGPGVPTRPNMAFIAAYFYYPIFFHREQTFLQDVQKLPPAHTMTLRAGVITMQRYWHYEDIPALSLPADTAYAEMLCDLLTRAVHCRMRSAYPVGTHLSGGLDSSTITVLAARYLRELGQQLTSFSWSPPYTDTDLPFERQDERRLVEIVARQEQVVVMYTELLADDIVSWYTRDILTNQTVSSPREVVVRKTATKLGIRVLLSGWGCDQVILPPGGSYLAELFLQGRWLTLWREFNMLTCGRKSYIKWSLKHHILFPLLPDVVCRWQQPALLRPQWPALLRRDCVELFQRNLKLSGLCLRSYPGVRNNQLQALRSGLASQRTEAWAIDAAADHLEYRYPLLDRRIIEFGLGLPADQHFKHGWGRYVVRQAVSTMLPSSISWIRALTDEPSITHANNPIYQRANQTMLQRMLHKDVPCRTLYCLDEERLYQCQLEQTMSLLSKGFARAIQCEYISQYHAKCFH